MQVVGGAAKVNAIKTLHQNFTMESQGAEMQIDASIIYPDRQAQKIKMPQGDLIQVVTPASAFLVMSGHARELPPSVHASELAGLKRDFLNVLQHSGDARYSFNASGKEKVDGIDATVVDVSADGATTRWWIAPGGELLQEQYTEVGQSGPSTMTVKYSEWKSFDGLKLPTKYALHGGEEAGDSSMSQSTRHSSRSLNHSDSDIRARPSGRAFSCSAAPTHFFTFPAIPGTAFLF